ncbi:MAG: UDP-N-acetylmuramoyl-tripeptide--D-alanyl-D-alanine ligase [Flavobacteriales bacterium]|nr:MAG: UDP-N-acetylmuramoyl-tripeptide--D-alanyl-D-alanine ligase [Flavobacteriales bacterium]
MPAHITIAQLHQRLSQCSGTSTDTRSIQADSLFFALKGPNFDANTFAKDALAQGARYAVVDDPTVVQDDRYLLVPDVLQALQDLARHHRRQFNIPFIGITGTNGKTTTKELVHAVLSADRPTLATSGNLNNHIGVPLTLLRLTKEHRIAIIEMGANKPGDIAELCAIAEPTHGLITNIGKAHLEGFGGFEGVVRTKTELYTAIAAVHGKLFVHADDALLMARSEGQDRITYGRSATADTGGDRVGEGPFLEVVFAGVDGAAHHVQSHLVGGYNLPNVLAAVAMGQHFGVADERISQALSAYTPSNNRSQYTDTGRNQLVLDAYNANPTSMAAALENFATLRSERPKLAILGGMRELGHDSRTEHETVIGLVHRLGLDAVYIGNEFVEAGGGQQCYPDVRSAKAALRADAPQDRLILVKGSRGIRLEELLEIL